MPSALRTSLDGLFDDAGLFPPARHPMAEALALHARMRAGPHRRLVGPFLCPVGRLEELDACLAGGLPRPEALGLVVYPGDVPPRRCFSREGVVQVEAPFGMKLPSEAVHHRRYVELPPGEEVAAPIERIAAERARVKVRCGGATPDTVPPVGRLAEILHLCAAKRLPLKATAGLHQPFRHCDEATGAGGHGFLNLLAGASMAMDGRSRDELAEILAASPDDNGTDVIDKIDRRARELLISVGTCSLAEPVEALHDLGLLE